MPPGVLEGGDARAPRDDRPDCCRYSGGGQTSHSWPLALPGVSLISATSERATATTSAARVLHRISARTWATSVAKGRVHDPKVARLAAGERGAVVPACEVVVDQALNDALGWSVDG